MVTLYLDNPIIREDMEQIYASRKHWDELLDSRILVTGATGMIASYLTLFLIYLNEEKGFHIKITANARSKKKVEERFGELALKNYFQVLEGDVCDVKYQGIEADYVIHAASLASPQYYASYPVETMLPNVTGTQRLLDYIRERNEGTMLFFSSQNVYGSLKNITSVQEEYSGPLQFLDIRNLYGEAKRCGEALCVAYQKEYGVPAKIARISATYGPSMDYANDIRSVQSFVRNALYGQDIVMTSDGSAKLCYCYLSDMVSGLLFVMLDGSVGEPYNISNSSQLISIADLANKAAKLNPAKELEVVMHCELADKVARLPDKIYIPVNSEKLTALGWTPSVDIDSGLKRTVEYLRPFLGE